MNRTSFHLPVLAGLLLGAHVIAQTPPDVPWWRVNDEVTVSLFWNFDTQFPAGSFPPPDLAVVPSWYNPLVTGGVASPNLTWIPTLGGHVGVLGLIGNGTPQTATLDVTIDNDPHLDWVKIFTFKFDAFEGSSGDIAKTIEQDLAKYGRAIVSEESAPLGGGWEQVTIEAQLIPQPDDEGLDWTFFENAFGTVAIDNLFVSSKCVNPMPDRDGVAMGLVDGQRINLTLATGGAECTAVAVTEPTLATPQRTFWVAARGLTAASPHQLFRLNSTGIAIGTTVSLPVSALQAPLGPTDLAVETILSSTGLIQQQIIYAITRLANGSIQIFGVDQTGAAVATTTIPGLLIAPQRLGLAFDPSGNLGLGTFWVSDTNGNVYEFNRAGGLVTSAIQIGPAPPNNLEFAAIAYDETLGNFYGFSRAVEASPNGPVAVNGYEWSGYDFQLTGVRFCGDLTLPNPGGPRGGLPLGLEVYRPRGNLRSELRLVCVVEVQNTQFAYQLAAPFGFGWSQFGRCGMRGGPPYRGSTTFQVTLTGVPNAALAMMFLGFSNTNYSGVPLPVSLGGIGMLESQLSVSPDIASGFLTPSATGEFVLPLPIPNSATLGYAPMFFQWIVLDGSVPGLLAMTQAGKTVIYP